MRHYINIILVVLYLLLPKVSFAQTWSPEESIKIKTIKDVQISPDNHSVILVVSGPEIIEEKCSLISRLYKVDLITPHTLIPLTSNENSSIQPKWSPDGKWIAFLSDNSLTQNLSLINSNTNEIIPLTSIKNKIQTFQWSPDSTSIALVMPQEINSSSDSLKKTDAIVYGENNKINRLWLLNVNSPTILQPLTPENLHVRGRGDYGTINEEFDWSPDGKFITFAYSPKAELESYYLDSSIATLELQTGSIKLWEKKAQHESLPRYSPNGTWIAYLYSDTPTRYANNRYIAIRQADSTHFRPLEKTFNEGPFLIGPTLIGWNKESNAVLFFEPKGTQFHLSWLPIDGNPITDIKTDNWFVQLPVLSHDHTHLAFVAQTPDAPPEAYISSLTNFKPQLISNLNQSFQNHPKIRTEVITWKSSDDQSIEGLLTYPINYHEGKRYPLLLIIHGGPYGFFYQNYLGSNIVYPLAAFAEAGFAILRPNPRGSCGYGKTFRCANYGDWGGGDYRDIMAGVDDVINKGIADPDKLGVMGWSYGGYMTAWIITQTQRFKAASIGAGVFNLTSMSGTMDLHHFIEDYMGYFAHQPNLYQQRSPIYYAENVTTPCLIQHGIDDLRVPVSQAYELYHALNHKRKIATLILYPRCGHSISEPCLQIDAGERNLDWFKKHLQINN